MNKVELRRIKKARVVNPDVRMREQNRAAVKRRWQLYLMVLPALIYIVLFAYKPMYGILIAFKDFSMRKGIWGSDWVGFENFQRVFNSYWFPITLKNTLTISILSLVLGFPIPIILALLVNELKHQKVKKILQVVTYAPHFISTVVMCGMITMFLNPNTGIINIFIKMLGREAVYFMQKAEYFPWVYVISGIWQGSGWGAIIYYAALSGVDKSLLEAAEIDGANRIQRIRYINFPVLVPTIVIMFILQCGSLLSVGHEKVFLLQTTTNLSASEVLSTYVYKMGLVNSDFSFSTAVGLFNNIVNVILLVTVNTISKKVGESSLW